MKILIVRLKQIGDAVLSLPICNTLRKSAPDAQIHFMVYQHIAPLFETHPSIDKLITISLQERKSTAAFFRKLQKIRSERYDAVLDVMNTPTSMLIVKFSGAAIQAGFRNHKFRSWFYKNKVMQMAKGAGRRKLPILEALDIPLSYDYSLNLHLGADELHSMGLKIQHCGMSFDKPLIAMMVHSRRDYKIWPASYFAKLANYLIENYDAQLYFVCGPGEENQVKSVADQVKKSERVFMQPVTQNTRDMACLLACVDLFIGNDGGPRHIAQAVGTSSFSIFSPLVSKAGWLPNYPDPMHRAIDITDVRDVTEQDSFDFKKNIQRYYLKITPQKVINMLEPMLVDKFKKNIGH